MEDKELIWVPKKKAEEFAKATNEAAQLEIIDKIIEGAKRSMAGDLEGLEEDAAYFRGMLIRHKKAYSDVLEEHTKSVEAVWEEIQAKIPNFSTFAKKTMSEIKDAESKMHELSDMVDRINKQMENVNDYRLNRFLDIVDKVSSLDESSKELLEKVIQIDLAVNKNQ